MKETIKRWLKRVNLSYLNFKIALKSIKNHYGYGKILSYFFITLFLTVFLLETFAETVPPETVSPEAVVPEEEVVPEEFIIQRLNKHIEECEVSTQIQLCEGLYIGKGEVWTGTETFCEGASIKTTFKEEVKLNFLIIENPEERLPTGVFSRPRDIKITLQGTNPNATTYYSQELEDTDEAQWIEVDNTTIKSVTIEILSGYPPEGDGVYCAIDEIEFYGSSDYEPNIGGIVSTTLSNQNDGAGLNPEININICNNSLGLYETETYRISYKFYNKPKKFTIVFTDSTGDLNIDLLSKIESQGEDRYVGNVTVNAYPEGLPGEDALKTIIVAEDILGGKSYLTCSNDLYTINMRSEGDYKREHLRTPLVRDEHYQTSVSFTGKIWEQNWESLEDCATDDYILEWDVADINNDLEYYSLTEPITGEEYCSLDIENSIIYRAKKYTQSFTYPVLNEEDTIFTTHYSFEEVHPVGNCAAIINDEIFNYVETVTTGFQRSLNWGDHWGMTFTGSYRLVGVNTQEPYSLEELIEVRNDPQHRSRSPRASAGYSSNFPESGEGVGHRNSPPEKSFYLSEYGLVDRQPIRYISFIFEIYTFTGGNHGMYEYLTFNYDLDECRRIYLKDIMTDEKIINSVNQYSDTDALWLDLLASRVGDIWGISKGTPGGVDLKASYDTMRAVSINQDGLTISFQPYALQAWAFGWPEVSISWINLWDIFTWGKWDEREYTIYEDTVLSEDLFEDFLKKDNLIKHNWVADELFIGATHSYRSNNAFFSRDIEYTISDRPIYKQAEGATYGLEGDFTQKDKALVKRFVNVVNHIIGEDFISYSDNPEEVTVPIKISEPACLSGNMWDYLIYGDNCGLVGWFSSEENTVWIDSSLFGRERDSTLIHELGHSIGLWHTSCEESGLMSIELWDDILSFSDYEIALIKFLYSPLVIKDGNDYTYKDIEKGMTFDDLLLLINQGWTHSSFDMESSSPSEAATLIRTKSEGLKDSPEDGICVYPDIDSGT